MTTRLKVDASGILEWSAYLDQIPKKTKPAIAKALNDYGRGVAAGAAEMIAQNYDLDPHEVLKEIDIREATPERLVWEMDASTVAPPPPDWERPWDKRSTSEFDKQNLVNIVTVGDHVTCEICEEAEENSPYTMEEINNLAAKWQHWEPPAGVTGTRTNLLHPNCRCSIVPYRPQRNVAVQFGGGKSAPRELFTARQLGKKVADEIRVSIRAIQSR
jgi:hypothetical protein